MVTIVSLDTYREGSSDVKAHRYHPRTQRILRLQAQPRLEELPPSYGLYRDGITFYLIVPRKASVNVAGEVVRALPASAVQNVATQAMVGAPPQLLALREPERELRAFEYYRKHQNFSDPVPPTPSTTLPPSVTGGYSDTTIAFVLLAVALFLIIFLSSQQKNWLQYHD